jgi:iron-sulfur cluster repair protein YtfE (RIC family)
MSTTSVSPFLEELKEIRKAAAELPPLSPAERRKRVAAVLKFVEGPLARHAEAEERAFFPVVAQHLRHPAATGALVFDHELVRERANALNAADPRDVEALQALLYGLHAILDAHFRKQERLYVPLLEGDEPGAVFHAMDAIEHPVRDGDEREIQYGPHEFPLNGTPGEKLAWAVRFAVMAPSSHNSQPWLFRVAGETLELRADRTRGLPVVDPHDRELTISCGAALFFLRAALRHMGETASVDLIPDPGDPDLLARVRLAEPVKATQDERRLFWAMRTRRTNRRRYSKRLVPEDLLAELRRAAVEEGAWLDVIEGGVREQLAKLVATADRRQSANPSFRRELASWVHPNREHASDGMPGSALGISNLVSNVGPLVLRTFDWGRGRAARDEQLALGSPVLAVLGTDGDDARDWLAAGQALGRVLLRATIDDLVSSFLNQPLEIDELRWEAAGLCGGGAPQLVLRFGFAEEVAPTPRRPVDEVLDDAS